MATVVKDWVGSAHGIVICSKWCFQNGCVEVGFEVDKALRFSEILEAVIEWVEELDGR